MKIGKLRQYTWLVGRSVPGVEVGSVAYLTALDACATLQSADSARALRKDMRAQRVEHGEESFAWNIKAAGLQHQQ
eukprot:1994958-Amphidinium_carterae.1